MKKSSLIRAAVTAVLCVAVLNVIFRNYVGNYYHAKSYQLHTEQFEETEDYIVLGNPDSEYGFIFYPGARVEETAYIPLLDELSGADICCVLVKMPYRLAIFSPNAAADVMESVDGIEHWYLGGHSLGGAMAASYAASHEDELEGLVLLAAYPTRELEELPVLSVYGSEDGVLSRKTYERAIGRAGELTEHVIEGGNHSGFGNYGQQKKDHAATVTAEEQWQETVDYILNFIAEKGV